MEDKTYLVSLKDLENAFCEWNRRYTEDKEQFDREIEALLNAAPGRYALICAIYLLKLVDESSKQEANDSLEL